MIHKNTDATQRKRKQRKRVKENKIDKIKWSTPTTHTHNYGLLKTLELKWMVRACANTL